MNANELRIGNWVTVDNPQCYPELKNKPVRVRGIGVALGLDDKWTYGVCISTDDIRYSGISQFIHFVIPIPLSEELLLKCGFSKREPNRCTMLLSIDDSYTISDNICPTLQWWIGKDYVTVARSGIGAKSVKCNSLHQLQNLYYALTGKELGV